MAAEPLGCVSSSCNSGCPDGTVVTYNEACTPGDASSGTRSRCCPADSYPDVLLLVDRGTGQSTTLFNNVPHADYSLLNSDWTTAKELLALPGEAVGWQQLQRPAWQRLPDTACVQQQMRTASCSTLNRRTQQG